MRVVVFLDSYLRTVEEREPNVNRKMPANWFLHSADEARHEKTENWRADLSREEIQTQRCGKTQRRSTRKPQRKDFLTEGNEGNEDEEVESRKQKSGGEKPRIQTLRAGNFLGEKSLAQRSGAEIERINRKAAKPPRRGKGKQTEI
jgi:hypothetical protein